VTTHNPATLDALAADQLRSVVLCVPDAEKKTSKLLPLMQVPNADLLLESGGLGNLVTRKVLERHLLPNFSDVQRKAAEDWLKSLQ
jgi:hypothetical protein